MTVEPTVFSPCRFYRYELWRRWEEGPYAMFIGLNPSTADETNNDPTVRRCIAFARDWGYAALCMANIFAWRDTQPDAMKARPHPIGPENDQTLIRLAAGAGVVIAAWGKDGKHLYRGLAVKRMIPNLHCLGTNSDRSPKHPLYLKASLAPIPFQ